MDSREALASGEVVLAMTDEFIKTRKQKALLLQFKMK
jgi:hypothetical protein